MKKKLSIQSLNSLFDHFQNLPETVFWIRDIKSEKQLYLSSSFSEIWEQNLEILYEHPDSWADFLIPSDKVTEQMNMRLKDLEQVNDIYYQIKASENKAKYIKDSAYILTDIDGESVGMAGFAQQLTEPQWKIESSPEYDQYKRMQNDHKNQVFGILKKELGLKSSPLDLMQPHQNQPPHQRVNVRAIDGKKISVTSKEHQVLWHLLEGLTAKETAKKMFISPRTVEFHLNNLKLKVGCNNKVALLAHVVLI